MELFPRLVTKVLLVTALSTLPLTTFECVDSFVPIIKTEQEIIKPFERIWQAQCMVESTCNRFAINHVEQAYGIVQIRQVRLDDYYKRTGIRYTLEDCFNIEVSKNIYMYYAGLIGHYDLDKVVRSWNGSGPMTYTYLELVKAQLKYIT